ncbi:MAG: VOC family protein [Opitutales bacterium]|jgi:catechol 2,3-dioxygenase-like lactoylglutathione lyase family enzyme
MKLKFDMVGLFVADIHLMAAFYRDVMGFETAWDGESPYAEFKSEGIRFAMFERRHLPALLGREPGYPQGLNGTFELASVVGKPENVDKVFDEIVAKGGTKVYAPRDEPWKMRSAMIADPEGNLFEIASDAWE